MNNRDEILMILEEFDKEKPREIPTILDDYLAFVARTGDPVFMWGKVKYLFQQKLEQVLSDFHDNYPEVERIQSPNVEAFNFDTMKTKIMEQLDGFVSAPFTIQRLSELLIAPRREYNRTDKYMRAVEKNVLVVTTRDPEITFREIHVNGIVELDERPPQYENIVPLPGHKDAEEDGLMPLALEDEEEEIEEEEEEENSEEEEGMDEISANNTSPAPAVGDSPATALPTEPCYSNAEDSVNNSSGSDASDNSEHDQGSTTEPEKEAAKTPIEEKVDETPVECPALTPTLEEEKVTPTPDQNVSEETPKAEPKLPEPSTEESRKRSDTDDDHDELAQKSKRARTESPTMENTDNIVVSPADSSSEETVAVSVQEESTSGTASSDAL